MEEKNKVNYGWSVVGSPDEMFTDELTEKESLLYRREQLREERIQELYFED